jgi:hypothetical protein
LGLIPPCFICEWCNPRRARRNWRARTELNMTMGRCRERLGEFPPVGGTIVGGPACHANSCGGLTRLASVSIMRRLEGVIERSKGDGRR